MTARTAKRTGLRAMKAAIQLRGLSAISRRTKAGRDLIAWKNALVNSLGGPDNVSVQKMAIIEAATCTKALLSHADNYLLSLDSIVNRRKKALLPILAQRQSLCDQLSRLLQQIGLERAPKPIPSLKDYLDQKGTTDDSR